MEEDRWFLLLYPQLRRGVTVDHALRIFKSLVIVDWHTGDDFFETFGVGNTEQIVEQPYERFRCYELLLKELKKIDKEKMIEYLNQAGRRNRAIK